MDVKKFNEEATNLINSYKGEVFFTDEATILKNASLMRDTADAILKCHAEAFNICVEQNITAIGNVEFGKFLIDLTRLYYLHMALNTPITSEEAEAAVIGLMSNMSVDEMRKALILSDPANLEKDVAALDLVAKYDAISDGIIKDAFKTMSIKNILGV